MAEGAQFVAIYFSHQSNSPHDELAATFAQNNVVVAYDGMVLEI